MHARPTRFARGFVCLALAAVVGGAAAAAPKAEAGDAASPASAAASAAPVHAMHEMRDPLDVVRERLAARLGAIKAPDTPNPNVLRVTSQAAAAAEPAEASASRPAATAAAHVAPIRVSHATSMIGAMPQTGGRSSAHGSAAMHEPSTCTSGNRQSPIDLRDGLKVDLEPVQFDYKPSTFSVVDNGHTVQVNVAAGNAIEVMGRRFELVEFHFHRPSEERIDGKPFDMVAHLVHKDAAGRLAIVAVLLERGSAQPIVQSVWNNLPLEKGDELRAKGTLDLNALLPSDRRYFTYMGSLTTPPCTEGVLWMVMKAPVPISEQQLGIFARLYPMNARPIQPTGDRLIKESN